MMKTEKKSERERQNMTGDILSLFPQDEKSRDQAEVDAEQSVKRLLLGHRAIRGKSLRGLAAKGWLMGNESGRSQSWSRSHQGPLILSRTRFWIL